MIARISVSMIFVPKFGYLAICFTDQAAWIAACLYIVPVCIYCVNKAGRHIAGDHGLPVEINKQKAALKNQNCLLLCLLVYSFFKL